MPPARVLILCTANSARSQMAEAWLQHLGGDRFAVFSAGTQPSRVNPVAIQAMAEAGLDLSGHRSKSLTEFLDQPFDYVITVCDAASESCPAFPGPAQRLHWSFPDPAAAPEGEARLAAFRAVRDGLRARFENWLAEVSA
ncbi:MAG: arsenate reductase ArsC [Anaerolineae bacterium]|nr:arsenate reductase ArsC [Anaerolineae bacterium]